ncbi:hypothetical protein ACET3X_008937 [Alternaria dauci]|uniref:BTB domain-containing protein n=1 Tax=Alternaria dauci TaxID=48095 RepID=A0ABR3U7W5_9PLEO
MEPPKMDNAANFKPYPHISGAADFHPPQMLMQTPITIECGPDLKTKLTVHEELLCVHSKQLQGQFEKAKSARTQFAKAEAFREKVAAFVYPECTQKDFEDKHLEQQVKPLIKQAYENYPLIPYFMGVKKIIMDEVASQISAKNIKKTAQKPSQIPPDLSLSGRLDLLKPHAVQAVVSKLFERLHAIQKSEVKKAERDALKAAAQYRLILPDVEGATVRCFMQWIYRARSMYADSEQLYSVFTLARRLGLDELASICLNQLYNAATDSLMHSDDHGIPLQTLLGYGPDVATDDIVGVVFKHAFKDEDAPKQLKSLVVDTLAASLNPELWQHVKDLINHGMALQVIEAMVGLRQHVKWEADDQEEGVEFKSDIASSASTQSIVPVDDEKISRVGGNDEKQV